VAATTAHPIQRSKWHRQRMATRKANDLARDGPRRTRLDGKTRADRHGMDRPSNFHHQSPHRHDAAVDLNAIDIDDLFGERFHVVRSSLGASDTSEPGTTERTRADAVATSRRKPALRLTGSGVALTRCLPASLIIGSFVH